MSAAVLTRYIRRPIATLSLVLLLLLADGCVAKKQSRHNFSYTNTWPADAGSFSCIVVILQRLDAYCRYQQPSSAATNNDCKNQSLRVEDCALNTTAATAMLGSPDDSPWIKCRPTLAKITVSVVVITQNCPRLQTTDPD